MSRAGVPAAQAAYLSRTEDRWLRTSADRLRRRRLERAAQRVDQRRDRAERHEGIER